MTKRLADLALSALALLVPVLMLIIVAQVACAALGLNPLLRFEEALALFGQALTLNSLLDLQWHGLTLIGLFGAGLLWWVDGHVRVDFLYATRSSKAQARIDLAGNILFALPFFALILPAAQSFAARAWASDEGSRSDGLMDLWLIKSALPLGLALLALVVAIETLKLLGKAAR
jgi:TRAP-type mannitol/chloroaromatic compound transport system permease small subunit